MRTALLGFVIAVVIGIPLGTLLGMSRIAARSTQFLVDFGRTIPVIALMPLAVLVFKLSFKMGVLLVIYGAIWPVLIQATYAVGQITPQSRQMVRAFHITLPERIRFVYAPSMTPFLMTALRLSASVSLLMAFTTEFLVRLPGLGVAMRDAGETDPHATVAYMLTAGLLGAAISIIVLLVQRRVLWWHPSQRGKGQ